MAWRTVHPAGLRRVPGHGLEIAATAGPAALAEVPLAAQAVLGDIPAADLRERMIRLGEVGRCVEDVLALHPSRQAATLRP